MLTDKPVESQVWSPLGPGRDDKEQKVAVLDVRTASRLCAPAAFANSSSPPFGTTPDASVVAPWSTDQLKPSTCCVV